MVSNGCFVASTEQQLQILRLALAGAMLGLEVLESPDLSWRRRPELRVYRYRRLVHAAVLLLLLQVVVRVTRISIRRRQAKMIIAETPEHKNKDKLQGTGSGSNAGSAPIPTPLLKPDPKPDPKPEPVEPTNKVNPPSKDGQGKSVLDCAKSEWIRDMLSGNAAT